MSVLIKGMEMPSIGTYEASIDVTNINGKTAIFVYLRDKNDSRRFSVCAYEAVHIPPHGRLIDADALPTDIEWEDILDAPTVIEAVVSEEELQREYEANVEYAQYCERYEPTYDPETGGM